MGLSVTASLLGVHVSTGVGTAVTAVAAVVFISLVTGTVRAPMFDDVPAWSMMTMGVLAWGPRQTPTSGGPVRTPQPG